MAGYSTPAARITASAFRRISVAIGERIAVTKLRQEQLDRQRTGIALLRQLLQYGVQGDTPSPGITRVLLSSSSRGMSGTSWK